MFAGNPLIELPRATESTQAWRLVALDNDTTYEQIFRAGLNRSNYNILLYDYAYFQFSWIRNNSWRLGYFPNPWVSGVPAAEERLQYWETLEEIDALTYEEASELISEISYIGSIPPIRFEYAADQYREIAHPAAHFHIGRHSENRWPSSISIGPKAFVFIIAKLYYPNAWAQHSSYHGAPGETCIEKRLLSVLADVRVVHDFSEIERRSIHFGKNMTTV